MARILVIDDDPDALELMAYLLTAFGHSTSTAGDGEAGLLRAREERPDLIICDVSLPLLDGCGVVLSLKSDSVTRSIPVVAVTALAMVGDRERLLRAGFDGYLAKPFNPEGFAVQVETWLRDGSVSAN